MDPVVVRSISREYRIRTPSPELAALLAFFDARPELEGAPLVPVEITAEPLPEGFRLRLSNEEVAAGSALDALTRIFGFLLICIAMQFLLTGISDYFGLVRR